MKNYYPLNISSFKHDKSRFYGGSLLNGLRFMVMKVDGRYYQVLPEDFNKGQNNKDWKNRPNWRTMRDAAKATVKFGNFHEFDSFGGLATFVNYSEED